MISEWKLFKFSSHEWVSYWKYAGGVKSIETGATWEWDEQHQKTSKSMDHSKYEKSQLSIWINSVAEYKSSNVIFLN